MIKKFCLILLLFNTVNRMAGSRDLAEVNSPSRDSTNQLLNMILSGHFGGAASAVAVQGNYAYVGIGTEFAVIDISQPANPSRVAYLQLGAVIYKEGIVLVGSYAYVVAGQLLIIDISDPLYPTLVNTVPVNYIGGMAIQGSYAYLTHLTGMQIFDISQPNQPVQVGSYDDPLLMSNGQIVVSGRYAYYSGETCAESCDRFFRIVDVLDPASPTAAALYFGALSDLVVISSTAYFASGPYLSIVDVSLPMSLTTLGYYTATAPISNVDVYGSLVYLGDSSGLHTIDISFPAQPQVLDDFNLSGVGGMAALGSYGYAVNANGLNILDIQNPSSLSSVGVYQTIGAINTLAARGDQIYVPGATGFYVIDISNRHDPHIVGSTYTATLGSGEVALDGNYAYVAGSSGLNAINVSNPTTPVPVDFYAATLTDMVISGTYAYLGSDTALHVIDIADPSQLTEAGVITESSRILAISGNYLYQLQDTLLRIRDLTSPTQPSLTGNYTSTVSHWDVGVAGGYAYLTDPWTSESLEILDVTNPASPMHQSYYPSYGRFIVIVDQFAYLTSLDSFYMQVLNLTTPGSPQVVGHYSVPSGCQGVAPANGYIAVACGGNGLYVYKLLAPQAYLPLMLH